MDLQNYSIHIQGLPLIKLSYQLLPGGGNGWLQYIKFEQELTAEQQLEWQGLCPYTLQELRTLEQADPLRVRVSKLESLPFKAFWDLYKQYCNSSKAQAEKYWSTMPARERRLATQHLPDFVARKLKTQEYFPHAIRYLRNKLYHDFIK
jgi:hypothetical protein